MPEFLQLMENWDGFRPVATRRLNEAGMTRLLDLVTNRDGIAPHRREYLIREAVTTADFPDLFGGIFDRTLLARYRAARSPWREYVKVGRALDFRVKNIMKVEGQDTLLPLVPQKTEYPQTANVEGHYTNQVFKRGRAFDISWEATINDLLSAFTDLPARFADAALNTESRLATSLYCDAAAPAAALFGAPVVDAADGANVTNLGVLPLTITNLGITIALMAAQQDAVGNPLGIRGVHLVVPPALEVTARQILTSTFVQQVNVGGMGTEAAAEAYLSLPTANVLPQMGLKLHIDPWIPIVDTAAAANKTWFLFADLGDVVAMEMDFLVGHESPEIVMKASNKLSIGGGTVSPFEGDFESDDIEYRVRHVLGGTALDPRAAFAQVGP